MIVLVFFSSVTLVSAADINGTNLDDINSVGLETNVNEVTSDESTYYGQTNDNTDVQSTQSQANTKLDKNSTISQSKLSANKKSNTITTVSNYTVYNSKTVVLTATVVDKTTGKYVSGGNVTFNLHGINVGTTTLTNGKASVSVDTTTYKARVYDYIAYFRGNSEYYNSSAKGNLTVLVRPVTVTVLNRTTSTYNTTELVATVVDNVTKKAVTNAKLTFKINGKTYATLNYTNGRASYVLNTTNIGAKNYTITAISGYNGIYGTGEATAKLQVTPVESTIYVLNKSSYCNDTVSLVAVIRNARTNQSVSGGKVAFKLNGKTIGHVNITTGGKASLEYDTTGLGSGNYSITATYGGGAMASGSKSDAGILNLGSRITKLTINKVSSYSLNNVTLKATISDQIKNKPILSGKISFYVDGKLVAKANIVNGTASVKYDCSELVAGEHPISAVYDGTSIYRAQKSVNTLTINVQKSFSYSDMKKAAVYVRNMYESNHIVTSVMISKSRVEIQDYFAMLLQVSINCHKAKGNQNVSYAHFEAPTSQYDFVTVGRLNTSELYTITNKVLAFAKEKGVFPRYATASVGSIGYNNLIYTYSKVIDVGTERYLVSSIVYNWTTIHPTNPKSRPIYITSDIIISKSKDLEFMNKLAAALRKKGYNASYLGYGPSSHGTSIWNKELPVNAVQVSIFGGADAGVVYDLTTRSYMRTKENRLVFIVYDSRFSRDITNATWLERAWDDNYSPSSFTGIAYPDKVLKEHGYDYVFASDIDVIANAVIDYIS